MKQSRSWQDFLKAAASWTMNLICKIIRPTSENVVKHLLNEHLFNLKSYIFLTWRHCLMSLHISYNSTEKRDDWLASKDGTPLCDEERNCPETRAGWPTEAGAYGEKGTLFPTRLCLRKRYVFMNVVTSSLLAIIEVTSSSSKARIVHLVVRHLWAERQGSGSQTWLYIRIIWRALKYANAFVSPTGCRFTCFGVLRGRQGVLKAAKFENH